MTFRIMVVDDDPQFTEAIAALLKAEGYLAHARTDSRLVMNEIREWSPDLVILDILMPHVDGLTLTSLIRQESQVPIILLSAKSEPAERVIGLRFGADDYIGKPFDADELIERVRSVLRRASQRSQRRSIRVSVATSTFSAPPDDEIVQIGGLLIHCRTQEVWLNGEWLHLTPIEFRLLTCLARGANHTISRQRLRQEIWGPDPGPEARARTIDMHIWRLRSKLAGLPGGPVVETVRGFGYRLRSEASGVLGAARP